MRQQQLENQVGLKVEGAVIALPRSRAAYDAAVQALDNDNVTFEEVYCGPASVPPAANPVVNPAGAPIPQRK